MKKYLLLITILLCCAWKPLDTPPITEAMVNDKKEQCKMQLDAMFYDYNIVLNSKNKDEKRFQTIDDIERNYFAENALIDGNTDVSALHKEKYEVKDYFSNLQEVLSSLDAVLKTDVKNIGDICFDEGKNRYFLIANIEKKIVPRPGFAMNSADTVTRSVDIYYGFTLEDRKPKIFSVQQHRDDALGNYSPLPVINNEIADNSLSETKSYIVFKVSPSDAQVLIDGQPQTYTNGQQLELAPGVHQISISSNNYVKQAFPVTLESAATVAIEKNLDPQGGYLNVSASTVNDYGAAVYINDIQVGNVPLNNYPLATGRYNIRVAKDGYERLGIVGIAENRSVTVNASIITGQHLTGVIESGYRPVTVVLLPRYYFTPAWHTFRGAVVDPYYSARRVYQVRTSPNIIQYRNNTIWHRQSQLFRPQAGYRFTAPRNNYRPVTMPRPATMPKPATMPRSATAPMAPTVPSRSVPGVPRAAPAKPRQTPVKGNNKAYSPYKTNNK